ncbi:type II CRISPR-associated endonuclease Cas1 [uncultured Eubacterium sp.]|uniref:type II CRISPR-associated endonuclease Cas1 n=1 Tax=uncultured Eubacterium sp. TaxID=165185 RepID=UPI002638DD77|nr:type II CRISPR-associated endonuclease Cas1 [uncultured Eubacterium sp.]
MAFRIILIENEINAKIKLDNLVLNTPEGEIWIPVSDISVIVLDNLRITLSTRFLCTLAQNNVSLVLCDEKHLPIGLFCSYDNHSRAFKHLEFQIKTNGEFYDRLWKDIVVRKILNQAEVIKKVGKREEIYDAIKKMAYETRNGDKTNREAHAAKIYFNELMDTTFSRGNDELLLNSGLDYGYTIIRSYIARICVGYGLNSQLGIHHRNEYNRFNLVDDLMEPIRPMLDYFAYFLLEGEEYFTAEHRKKLINFLNHKIIYRNKKMYIANVIEEYVSQYAVLLSGNRNNIDLPAFNGYEGDWL